MDVAVDRVLTVAATERLAVLLAKVVRDALERPDV